MKKLFILILLLALLTSCASPAVSTGNPPTQSGAQTTQQTKTEEQKTTWINDIIEDWYYTPLRVFNSKRYEIMLTDDFPSNYFSCDLTGYLNSSLDKSLYELFSPIGQIEMMNLYVSGIKEGATDYNIETIELNGAGEVFVYAEGQCWVVCVSRIPEGYESLKGVGKYNYRHDYGAVVFEKFDCVFTVDTLNSFYNLTTDTDVFLENMDKEREGFFSYLANPETAEVAIEWLGSSDPFPYQNVLVIDTVEEYSTFVSQNDLGDAFVNMSSLQKEGRFKEFYVYGYQEDKEITKYSYVLEKDGELIWWDFENGDSYFKKQLESKFENEDIIYDSNNVRGKGDEFSNTISAVWIYENSLCAYYEMQADWGYFRTEKLPSLRAIACNFDVGSSNIHAYIHGSNLGFYKNDDPESLLGRILDGKLNDKNEIIDFFQTNK